MITVEEVLRLITKLAADNGVAITGTLGNKRTEAGRPQ